MKITHLHFKDHPILGTMFIDFTGDSKDVLDNIVIAGVNGTGKTTLLLTILEILTDRDVKLQEYAIHFAPGNEKYELSNIQANEVIHPAYWIADETVFKSSTLWFKKIEKLDEKIRPKVIYMPTEINFSDLGVKTLSYSSEYYFINIVDQKMIHDIPSFIASTINSEVYKNPDLPAKGAIDKVCGEINSLFDILDIDARMVGLNPEGEKLPVFKNSGDKVFDINHLSSGEKQLFVRAMALKMLNANNSIILIDEPEISMHPGWQQKIVKVYQQIGENNQIIIATHSPHVVASVPKENIKLLTRENGQIKLMDSKEINGSYGLPVDIVLKELMGLKTVRDPEVAAEITVLWDMLRNKKHDAEEFTRRYNQLENLLGSEDEDLLLMRIEIAKLNAQKEKGNAGNKKK